MKKLYVMFEDDAHRSYSNRVIKFVTANKRKAEQHFKIAKALYYNTQNYTLNLSEYEPTFAISCDNNFLRDLEPPYLTTANHG